MTADPHNIHQPTSFECHDQIFIRNGQRLQIRSSGSTYFQSPLNSSVSGVLHNLWHVPQITMNLISVSKFAKDNRVYFEFHAHHCLAKYQANDEVLIRDQVGSDGLY